MPTPNMHGQQVDVESFLTRPLVARIATPAPTLRPVWFIEASLDAATIRYARLVPDRLTATDMSFRVDGPTA